MIGDVPLGQVRASDIVRVLLTMEAVGLAASTQCNAYAALRSSFDDAVADGLLAVNPILRVRRPRGSTAEAMSLTVRQATALLAGAEGLRYAAVLRVDPGYRPAQRRGAGAALG